MDQTKIDKLKNLLDEGDDWAKLEVQPGVFVVKMPAKGRFKAKLALEVNPVDDEGKPLKRKGLFITKGKQFQAYQSVFQNNELPDVAQALDDINGEKSENDSSSGDVIGKL